MSDCEEITPLRVAVVGAGNWGRNLVRNFSDLKSLVAVVESSGDLRESLKEDYPNVEIYEQCDEVFSNPSIDAVAIATPAPTHFEVAKQAIIAGKDVFVEKPMTLRSEHANELIQLAEENDTILMVGHLLLYQPAIQWIKEKLDENFLGNIYSLHQERVKLGRARYIENVTWSLGVHDLAVLLYLVDEIPSSTFASGHCGLQKEVEDDVYVHLTFPSGVKAHLHNSWLWPENRRNLTVVGERGMLVYDEVNQRVVFHQKTIDADLNNRNEGEEVVFESSEQPLIIELSHFLDCCKNRTRPRSDGENGARVVEVLEQIAGG